MFKVNTHRTYPYPVAVTIIDDQGKDQVGNFTAIFKVMPFQKERSDSLLDQVLVGLDGIELSDADGNVLEGEAMLSAAKNDPSISMALVNTYNESVIKKNLPKA